LPAISGKVRGLIVPSANAPEAAVVEGVDVIPVNTLAEAAAFLVDELAIDPEPCRVAELFEELGRYEEDFADVRRGNGQAGNHDRGQRPTQPANVMTARWSYRRSQNMLM